MLNMKDWELHNQILIQNYLKFFLYLLKINLYLILKHHMLNYLHIKHQYYYLIQLII